MNNDPIIKINSEIDIAISKLKIPKIQRIENFPNGNEFMWLDKKNCNEIINERGRLGYINKNEEIECDFFSKNGFYVYKNLISCEDVDRAWEGFMRVWKVEKKLKLTQEMPKKLDPAWGRVGNIHNHVPEMNDLLHHPKIVEKLTLLMGREAVPFQTIPSFFGSEQPEHSDAIHMSTFPLGFLGAAWIALEDVNEDCGPLAFYPGTHKYPYYMSEAVGIGVNEHKEKGREVYINKYESFMQKLIKDKGLKPHYFTAKKGDVLVWHHNLIHAGSKVKDPNSTRKSLVCHYFAKGVVCYHDLNNSRAAVNQPK